MMKAAINASQFKSRYNQATMPRSMIVNAIFTNSPKKNVIGFAVPVRSPTNRRNANIPFGTTQHNPPNKADKNALNPPINPAATAAATVVANWIRIRRNINAIL